MIPTPTPPELPRYAGGPARSRSAFLAQVAHELRTPLTTLNAALGLMRRRIDGPESDPHVLHLFGLARSGTERLMALVEDWLDLAAMDAGTFALARSAVPADTLVLPAIERTRSAAARRGVGVELRVRTARAALGDATRLQRALALLLDRAILATAPGGAIVVRVEDAGEGLRVAVSGTTAPVSLAAPTGAVGAPGPDAIVDAEAQATLGVAVCREIVTRHGGRLELPAAGDDAIVVHLPAAA